MKVCLYGRYSDKERQSESSIDQQLRLLKDRASREDWEIVETITDPGISGATRFRPGWHKLVQAIHNREFDILLTESVDRLSRDMEDIAYLFKRCRHFGIQIVTLPEGDSISELHIGLKGTMSALYLQDLGRRTHRGLEQRALAGESTGGRCYGYKIEPRYDSKKNRVGGIWLINDEEAPHVIRIFQDFADKGKSPRKIAVELNREGVPGPRGGTWSASTIYGNRRRMTGILLNPTYVGRKVWSKQSFVRDPDTGRETGRLNDESSWITADVPHLRIIRDDLWERAQARMKALAERGDFGKQRRPRKLFSFLLKCGECGGGFAKKSQTQYGCASRKNKGTCGNALTISEKKLELAVLGTLRDRLMRPDLCDAFCREYTQHLNHIRRENNQSLQSLRSESARVESQIAKLIDAIKNGIEPALIRDEINGLQRRKAELKASLENRAEQPIFIHPNMAQRYRAEVQDLIESLNDPEKRDEAAELIRRLINKIVLTPKHVGKRSYLSIDLHGDLAGILLMSLDGEQRRRHLVGQGQGLADLAEIQQVKKIAAGGGKSSSGRGEKSDIGIVGCGPPQPQRILQIPFPCSDLRRGLATLWRDGARSSQTLRPRGRVACTKGDAGRGPRRSGDIRMAATAPAEQSVASAAMERSDDRADDGALSGFCGQGAHAGGGLAMGVANVRPSVP